MINIWQKIKTWLFKIQSSDEKTKRKYLILASAITMIVIIGLWLIHLKSTIQSPIQETQNQISNVSSASFWQIFKNGLNITGSSIKQNIQDIFSKIFKGQTITIK